MLFLIDQVRGKFLHRVARSVKLVRLAPDNRYLICVLGLGNWGPPLNRQKANMSGDVLLGDPVPHLTDSQMSRCTEVILGFITCSWSFTSPQHTAGQHERRCVAGRSCSTPDRLADESIFTSPQQTAGQHERRCVAGRSCSTPDRLADESIFTSPQQTAGQHERRCVAGRSCSTPDRLADESIFTSPQQTAGQHERRCVAGRSCSTPDRLADESMYRVGVLPPLNRQQVNMSGDVLLGDPVPHLTDSQMGDVPRKNSLSKPGNFPYPEQLRSYWVVNRQEFAEVASGTTLLPGVRCSESQSCQGFERVKLACFQQGVIFEGGRDVLLTDSHWRVTLQYNLTQIEEESRNLSILQSVSEYLNEIDDLIKLLPQRRGKRGLVDAGGHVLKFLFGTLENSDLEIIDGKMDYLYNTNEKIVHQAKEQLSSALSDTKETVSSARRKITKFHQAIESLAAGKVDSNLLTPHEYLRILKEIEKVIPPTTKLSPVLVKTPNRWIYSASEEHRLTLNCLTSDGTLNITSAVVKGVGEFRGIDMCDVVSEEFKVPARIHGSSVFSEQISEIVFPNVEEIYTSEEKELFSSEQETAVKVLQGLNERLGTLGVKEYRPEDVVRHLKSHILFGRRFYAAKVAAAGSFGLVSILMLVYMCYRFVMPVMAWWSSRRNRRRQRRSATLTEVFAKVRGLTSLDSPEGDQEGVNPGEINDVEQNVEAVEVVNLERLRDHMNCKSKPVSSKPGNFPYPEQLRSYWVVNRQEFAEVASGTMLLPGVRCSESQSCQGFERVKLA
ncbi:hypothetical protein J6590_085997 [Homalodisca vitripennis]|nr:hypothetical protein J6590_085997 [Homalodisca vitripennis]